MRESNPSRPCPPPRPTCPPSPQTLARQQSRAVSVTREFDVVRAVPADENALGNATDSHASPLSASPAIDLTGAVRGCAGVSVGRLQVILTNVGAEGEGGGAVPSATLERGGGIAQDAPPSSAPALFSSTTSASSSARRLSTSSRVRVTAAPLAARDAALAAHLTVSGAGRRASVSAGRGGGAGGSLLDAADGEILSRILAVADGRCDLLRLSALLSDGRVLAGAAFDASAALQDLSASAATAAWEDVLDDEKPRSLASRIAAAVERAAATRQSAALGAPAESLAREIDDIMFAAERCVCCCSATRARRVKSLHNPPHSPPLLPPHSVMRRGRVRASSRLVSAEMRATQRWAPTLVAGLPTMWAPLARPPSQRPARSRRGL